MFFQARLNCCCLCFVSQDDEGNRVYTLKVSLERFWPNHKACGTGWTRTVVVVCHQHLLILLVHDPVAADASSAAGLVPANAW